MNITNHLMTKIACCSLDTLTDHGRTEMPDMKRLCDISSAIIDHDRLRLVCFVAAKQLVLVHMVDKICEKCIADCHIDKARHLCHNFLEGTAVCQLFHNLIGDLDRCLVILLCRCKSAITLILAKIRSVRQGHLCIFLLITSFLKSCTKLFL